MKTPTACTPRRSVWWIVAAFAVVATVVVYVLTGSWRGVTVGGVSIVALLACALPCSIPLIVARLVTQRRNPVPSE